MDSSAERDTVTIEDENGEVREYSIEALFDMDDNVYALIRNQADAIVMRVENDGDEQFLVGIDNPLIMESILDAYQIAVEAAPAE